MSELTEYEVGKTYVFKDDEAKESWFEHNEVENPRIYYKFYEDGFTIYYKAGELVLNYAEGGQLDSTELQFFKLKPEEDIMSLQKNRDNITPCKNPVPNKRTNWTSTKIYTTWPHVISFYSKLAEVPNIHSTRDYVGAAITRYDGVLREFQSGSHVDIGSDYEDVTDEVRSLYVQSKKASVTSVEEPSTQNSVNVPELAKTLGELITVTPDGHFIVLGENETEVTLSIGKLEEYVELRVKIREMEKGNES